MGESKHTPGPWVEDKLDGNVYGRDHSLVAIPHATALRSEFDGRIAANAALIAAAPEMYEALLAAAGDLELYAAHKPITHALELVLAALDKAEGR